MALKNQNRVYIANTVPLDLPFKEKAVKQTPIKEYGKKYDLDQLFENDNDDARLQAKVQFEFTYGREIIPTSSKELGQEEWKRLMNAILSDSTQKKLI